jgi:O-antigen/teichoic acid export membrane protein
MSTGEPPPPEGSLTARPQRIGSNIAFSGAGRAWSAVLLFITIPIVVHSIGTAAYGVYALASVILGYVAFLDFGLTAAVVRSVSKYHSLGDKRALESAVGTAFSLLIALGAAGAALIVLVSPLVVGSLLHVPSSLQPDARFALQVAGVGFGINMLLVVFAGVVQGLQRMDIFAIRSVFLSTLTSGAQIAAVLLGGGLRALVVATMAVSVLGFLIFLTASRRLLPDVSLRPRLDYAAVRELTGFGLFRFINQASGQVTTQFDPIVIGIFQPISAVGYYAVPLQLTQRFHVVQDSVAAAYFPAAVELHSREDRARETTLYLAALKLVLVAMAFLIVVSVGYAGPIMQAWVGMPVADRAAPILAVLAVGYGLSALVGVPAQASDATGHQRWTAAFAVVSALLQLSVALVLVPRYGPIGAAVAVVVNTVVQGTVFVLVVQHRFLGIGLRTMFTRALLRPLLAGIALALVVVVARGFAQSTLTLIASLIACAVLYAVLTLAMRVWTIQEVELLNRMTGGLWSRISGLRLARRPARPS